jgi:hypothetical protein
MSAFDLPTDNLALAASTANDVASRGVDLRRRKSLLEKTLSFISDVQPGEGLGALILTINLCTLLGAY